MGTSRQPRKQTIATQAKKKREKKSSVGGKKLSDGKNERMEKSIPPVGGLFHVNGPQRESKKGGRSEFISNAL